MRRMITAILAIPTLFNGLAMLVAGPHALIHLVAIIFGHDHHAGFDLAAIVLPSALALYSAFPNPGEYHA
jgi:hypothetical protein